MDTGAAGLDVAASRPAAFFVWGGMANRTIRTTEKELLILEALEEKPSFRSAVRKARIAWSTFAQWRKDDPDFARRCEEARERGYEALEDNLAEVSLDPKHPQAITASIFLLKGARPQRYRDRVTNEHTGPDGQALTIVFRDRADGPQ